MSCHFFCKVIAADSAEDLELYINEWMAREMAKPAKSGTFKIVKVCYSSDSRSYSAMFLYYEAY